MTEVPQGAPSIIVVAEESVYDLLRSCGANWDVQHRVDSVGQMWDDLSGQRLNQQSVAIVFSDSAFGTPGELEGAIAAMAPFATTFVVSWNPATANALMAGVTESATAQGAAHSAWHFLDPSSKVGLLDGIRNVFAATGVQVAFPEQYHVNTDGPVEAVVVEEAAWAHSAPTEPISAPAVEQYPQPAYEVPAVIAPITVPVVAAPVVPAYEVPAPVVPQYQAAPAYAVQQPTEAAPGAKPIIEGQVTMAVTSSKGGSGKSTTAMMLATQIAQSSLKAFEAGLAEKPLKVVLVDMDTRDGQVASLIGRYVPTALNIRVSPNWDEETILANLVYDQKLGIDALLAPVRPRTADDVGPDFYRHVLEVLKTTHDVVIMDTSVNYLDPLISTVCLPQSTAILFVTTLATTSVQGMARALREITEPVENGGMGISRSKIGIVVNQSITEVGMDRDQVLQAALKVAIVGAIPLATKDVLTCTNYGKMHQLLKHPLLGPAYYKLAKTCMPHRALLPILDEGQSGAPAQAGGPVAPTPAPGVAPVAASEADKKRGMFGRRG